MTTLYKMDGTNKIRVWKITTYEDEGYEVCHGVLGGEMQYKFTDVFEGKANRTIDEQIELEVNALIKKKKDKGYVDSIARAKEGVTNALGLPLPMLGKPLKDVKLDYEEEYFIQYKYNGHRCLVTKRDGEIIAYSKSGKRIDTIHHILVKLDWLPEGVTLDGELYAHGVTINKITSWVRRFQEDSAKLTYVVYDIVDPRMPYAARFAALQLYLEPIGRCLWARTERKFLADNVLSGLLKSALDKGYEGLMLRPAYSVYESGKRSKNLIKVKQWITEEFPVVGIKASEKDGWGILTCQVKEGLTFDVSAPGTHWDKFAVVKDPDQYIGRLVQVQFAEYTPYGVPFHPVATYWRDPE